MENDKMKMVMMNEELFDKYASAARTDSINDMKKVCEEHGKKMDPITELSEFVTMTMFIKSFKKLLFNSGADECEE